MFRSILVPLDGTPFGEHALPAALAIARRTGAALHLVHVRLPSTAWNAAEVISGVVVGTGQEVQVERGRAYTDATLAQIRRLGGTEVDARVLEGPVAHTLAETARDAAVDLVVMSTHAHTGVSRLWHHGIADHLTRHLEIPILLVRGGETAPVPGREPRIRHVVLPLEGSAYSEQVLAHAVAVGHPFGARYTLLRVVHTPLASGYTLMGQETHVNEARLRRLEEEAESYLHTVAERLRADGLPVETRVLAAEDPADAILAFAGAAPGGERDPRSDVGLIAMETHGLGGVAHLLRGSVVERVVHGSPVPVLVHHAVRAAERNGERAYADSVRRGMGWGAPGA